MVIYVFFVLNFCHLPVKETDRTNRVLFLVDLHRSNFIVEETLLAGGEFPAAIDAINDSLHCSKYQQETKDKKAVSGQV